MHTPQGPTRASRQRARLHAIVSPLNRSLLARIDVFAHSALEQERGHVVREECSCLRIHHVQPIVIDQQRLLFEPIAPALLADLFDDARTDWAWEWWALEAATRLTAARAGNVGHNDVESGPPVDR